MQRSEKNVFFTVLIRVGANVCEPISQDVCRLFSEMAVWPCEYLSILSVINTARLKCA